MRLETLAVHAGRRVDPTTGAVTPAIHPSTTFEREPDGSYPRGFLYTRNANPNRNALLVGVETPSNPLGKATDVAAIGEIARAAGARYVCDNTTATPVLQSPFRLGADLIVHATTKFLGGHADVMGGAVVTKTRDPFFDKVRAIQAAGGAVPSPFDCWLVLRGLSTLPFRMRAHSEHALRVASFLARPARGETVHYPRLPAHPGHDIARRQMAAFGGMVSVEVRGDRDRALAVAAKVRVFTRATSFGGTESLVEHRASIEGTGTTTPETLLRLSIGLENADDLIEDLDQALA